MNYLSIQQEIEKIAQKCGRDPATIRLIAVSKGHPWEEVQPVYAAGCRHFGESRWQEAEEKMGNAPSDIHWHFIGTLQKNKVRKVIGKFVLIHSVDSFELAKKISECSLEKGIQSSILLEINVSKEITKHGLTPEQLLLQFDQFQNLPSINIEGLMTMAPLTEDAQIIRRCFSDLRNLRDQLGLLHLSMGMSHDYPIAIEEGSTLLRIGTAIWE